MREYMGLFRGKQLDNGQWVEGWLVKKTDPLIEITYCFILAYGKKESFVTWYPVDLSTVGECTALEDKNGKLIFEGDIVTIPGSKMMGLPAPVAYFPKGAVFQIKRNGYNAITLWDAEETVEVIGNIHDNPELLKGESK